MHTHPHMQALVYRAASHRESVGQVPTVSVTVSYPARREIRPVGTGLSVSPGENRLGPTSGRLTATQR